MIYQLIDLPSHIVGFDAWWNVTPRDIQEVLYPCIRKSVEKNAHMSFMLVLRGNAIASLSQGAWKEILSGIRSISRWKKLAIVTEDGTPSENTSIPDDLNGSVKIFDHGSPETAMHWLEADTAA